MKCGLICARSARTSASISRVREASSSASSSWPRHPAGHLVGGAHEPGRRRAREDLQRPDDPLLDGQRREHDLPDAAAGVVARDVAAVAHRGAAAVRDEPCQLAGLGRVVREAAVPGEQPGRVRQRDRGSPEEAAEVPHGLLRRGGREPGPQCRGRQRGRVQGAERGPVRTRPEVSPPEPSPGRHGRYWKSISSASASPPSSRTRGGDRVLLDGGGRTTAL